MSLTSGTATAGFSVTSRWNGSAVSGPEGTTRRWRLPDQGFDRTEQRA